MVVETLLKGGATVNMQDEVLFYCPCRSFCPHNACTTHGVLVVASVLQCVLEYYLLGSHFPAVATLASAANTGEGIATIEGLTYFVRLQEHQLVNAWELTPVIWVWGFLMLFHFVFHGYSICT